MFIILLAFVLMVAGFFTAAMMSFKNKKIKRAVAFLIVDAALLFLIWYLSYLMRL